MQDKGVAVSLFGRVGGAAVVNRPEVAAMHRFRNVMESRNSRPKRFGLAKSRACDKIENNFVPVRTP